MSEDPKELSQILRFQRSLLHLVGREEPADENASGKGTASQHALQLDQFVRKVQAKVSQ
jgi:hypothetical protein